MKNEKRIKFWMIIFAILILWGGVREVYAAVGGSLLQISTDGEDIIAYLECDSKIHSAKAQVAQYPCENVELVMPGDISIHTVIMMDNSLSVTESNRENIRNILRKYVQELPEKEMVSLAVFGEEIQFLTEKSQNVEELTQLIDGIEFHDQDTYLTDFLYQALQKIENDPDFTRFIVISDGVDNKAIGITKEELTDRLKESSRPIYTIGHIYGENDSQLKNMFALSRVSNGKELLIEDFEDISLIAKEVHDFSGLYALKTEIPQDVMDGGNRHVLLSLSTDGGDWEITGEAPMPFGLIEKAEAVPEPTQEPTPNPTIQPTPEPTLAPEPTPASVKESGGLGLEKVIGVIVLILAIIVFYFYQKRNKSDKKKKKPGKKPVTPVKPTKPETESGNKPVEEETVILDGRYLLVLRDRLSPEKIFRYPLDGNVIVGRNVDRVQVAIDSSRTISGQHCEFYVKANRFFVRDLNSINHTYLDGKMIKGEAEVVSGSIVKLGEAEFCIEIMPI
ncbi:MAG: FHA domain-containing protein [Lachnospiraceae bacterium]|jgi:hypothetical protein|nr:FHA domain-containing protein [Lachnospiraceae bacterium]MCI9202268.1 FHA domain-containing protein [Lachnospiraceae bacterium]